MKAADIPNLISVFRMLLVLPAVWLMLDGGFAEALLVIMLAGLSDALDGFLARHFNWRSRLGGLLDPLADKLLIVAVYATLGWLGLLPWWLVVLVLLRDVMIVAGAVAYHMLIETLDAEPSFISKLNTVAQITLGLMVIALQIRHLIPEQGLWLLMALVAVTTLASGIDYVWTWSRRARATGGNGR